MLVRLDRRGPVAVLLILVASVGFLAVSASSAAAHAALVASQPGAGAEVATTPGTVELRFSEPLIADLSDAEVIDPDGRRWSGEVADDTTIAVDLGTSTPGVYTVRWKTVSPIDGHTLRGSFRFGVGVDPGEEPHRDPVPTVGDLTVAAARTIEYLGLLAALGGLVLTRLADRSTELSWARTDIRPLLAVALAGGMLVVAGEAILAGDGARLDAVGSFLTSEPGGYRMLRIGAVAAALAASVAGVRGVVVAALVAAVALLSVAGHAAGARPLWLAIVANAGHLLAAGAWAGALLVMPWRRPPGGWRSDDGRRLVAMFTPIALPAFVLTVVLGSIRGAQELVGLTDLLHSTYGRVLAAKIVVVAAMVPLSLRAWRGRRPAPRGEAGLALLAVVAAAVLAAFPVPPQRLADDVERAQPGDDPSLPEEDDLTMGGDTGDVLVGLTVRPAEPGRNDVFVHVMPSSGGPDPGGLDVTLSVDGDGDVLERCGATCRRGTVELAGRETLEVSVAQVADEPATFTLPPLPAEDATGRLEAFVERMGDLRTYRYEEVLGPADPPILSEWEIQAPDRLHGIVYERGSDEVARETYRIGDTRYERSGPDDDWEVREEGPTLSVPVHIWDYPGLMAAYVVPPGGSVEDVPTTTISFFVQLRDMPIWYRVWVDDDDLVRRAEMRTRGHFMDHTYTDLDEPFTIEPPV